MLIIKISNSAVKELVSGVFAVGPAWNFDTADDSTHIGAAACDAGAACAGSYCPCAASASAACAASASAACDVFLVFNCAIN